MDDEKDEQRDDQKKVWAIALAILIIVGGGIGLYTLLSHKKAEAPAEIETSVPAAAAPAPAAPAEAAGEPPLVLPAVPLNESDPVVREYGGGVSANAVFARWLQSKDLIRRFVAAVDNVANGLSPKPNADFFSPQGAFKVAFKTDGTFVDETTYARYDPVADVFASFDTAAAARFYKGLKPLLQDAYKDLGYPGTDFNETLVRAMGELLETPVVEGRIRLERRVLSFKMTDEKLEGLSQAQKQLLRMGPRNVKAIQLKIRDLAKALGIADSALPAPKTYRSPDAP